MLRVSVRGTGHHRRWDRPGPDPIVPHGCPDRLPGLALRVAPGPAAHRRLSWPDSTEAQALTNLRRELHQLRQVLGDEPSLLVTSRDLCWQDSPTCRVDVRTFDLERQAAQAAGHSEQRVLTHAARAVTQYKGDFLPGAYDDWLLEARTELERQCVELCDLLSQAHAATGDLAGAVQSARRRITLQPLEETGYRTLMRLQADLGDRARALSTYVLQSRSQPDRARRARAHRSRDAPELF